MAVYETLINQCVWEEVIVPGSALVKEEIKTYTLDNGWMSIEVINYGATVKSILVPDKNGKKVDVALGYNSVHGYMFMDPNPYLGSTIGRVCNRIGNASFEIDGILYHLSKNNGDNCLHGGVTGFNKKIWCSEIDEEGVKMTMISEHLDQGFPGTLKVQVKFVLTKDNNFVITIRAKTDQTTPVNLTNHTYFNLAGHNAGPEEVYKHRIRINAMSYTPVNENLIPTGKITETYGTPFDLNEETTLGLAISGTPDNGFDNNYCVPGTGMRNVARVVHEDSGRVLEIRSNQPGVQFYTANFLKVEPEYAKDGAKYVKHGSFCLETQNYPDAVNHANFPNSLLDPESVYEHVVSYKFSIYEPPTEIIPEAALEDS